MIWEIGDIRILIAVSILLQIICAIGALLACRATGRGFTDEYTMKIRFYVDMEDELVDIQKKHRENKYTLLHKLAPILGVTKEYLNIGMCVVTFLSS